MVDTTQIGEWSFLAGILIAVLVGLVPGIVAASTVATVLVVLGILVGLINIGTKETADFLIATIALLVAGAAGLNALPAVGSYVGSILSNIVAFVAPAAVIVALKAVYEIGK